MGRGGRRSSRGRSGNRGHPMPPPPSEYDFDGDFELAVRELSDDQVSFWTL